MRPFLSCGAVVATFVVTLLTSASVEAQPPQSESSPPAPSEIAALYHAIESPRLDASMPAPARIMIGRAEIRPAEGSKIWRMVANGRPCGVVLDGPASWSYRVEDRFSQSIARKNSRRLRLEAKDEGGALVLGGNLRGLAIWSWSLAAELDPEAKAWEPVGLRDLPEWAVDRLVHRLSANPSRDLLMSDANGDPKYAWTLLHGERADYVLDWDARANVRAESLSRAETEGIASSYRGRWSDVEIATQPIGRTWWDASAALEWVSVATDLDVREEPGERARVVSRVRLEARAPGLKVLALALLTDTANGAGTLRPATLERVSVGGQKANYVADRNHLLIALPAAAAQGQTVEIETVWTGELLARPGGDNYWRVGGIPWYPWPTGAGSALASSFHITLEVKKPFLPFAPGRTLERTETAQTNRVVTELAGPMSVAYIGAGKYATATANEGDFRIGISTYGSRLPGELEHAGQVVLGAKKCLTDLLASAYPFSELHLLEVNEWGWGQAPPGMIFITKEAFLSKARVRAMPSRQDLARAMLADVDGRLTHEVAHGWFPHVAQISESEEEWLSESFAEYVSSVCSSLLATGPSEREAAWRSQLGEWKNLTRSLSSDAAASVFLANRMPVSSGDDFATRRSLLYGKGPLVLHALRQELERQAGNVPDGDRLFFTWLRRILADRRFQITRTRDIVAILDELTAKPWRPWFEKYVFGSEVPAVE
ncbi:MAG TPA: M1 family aminopeptidase [Thermoanaerobaculia bacterium]|nr:M1 family aminopeptidase [Thermoanaerobaculia bacterium]